MHPISPATLNLLQNKKGLEPIVLLEIFWTFGSESSQLYCDKDIEGISGKILELGELESIINVQGNSTSTSISVTLSDADGQLKSIFDQCDIHKRKVKVYQWFTDLPLSEKILLFIGYISSPIVWSERERSLSFEVVTKVEDQEIGFSVEEGTYKNIPDRLIGAPWPLGFGKCIKVPTLALNKIPDNVTATIDADMGVVDPSINRQIGLGNANTSATMGLALYWITAAGYAAFIRDFHATSEEERSQWNSLYEQLINTGNQLLAQIFKMGATLSSLSSVQASQRAYAKPTVNVSISGSWPERELVPVKLGGTNANGFFSGSTFNFTYVEHPLEPGINQLVNQPVPLYQVNVGDIEKARISKLGFHYIDGGAEIVWRAPSHTTYVVNLLDCEIRAVYARKNGKLRRVPKDYIIDKSYRDFGLIKAKTVTIGKRMPDGNIVALPNADEGWEGEIWVTFEEKEIGNNTVDQIRYLIETYTQLTCDQTSFDYVRAKLTKWPSNFAFLDRPQVLDAIKDMAWQARCAIWIVDETVYIKYLPEEVAAAATLTEEDIAEGSFQITLTETEEIVTKLVALWRPNYYNDDKNKVILRYNTAKYGSQEQEYDFYIYNNKQFVLKAATFWIIRYANTWKKVQLKTYLEHIGLESFDTVLLDMVTDLVANGDFKALVEECSYDSSDNTISLNLWTPILAGTMRPFDFAWPANILVSDKNPRNPDAGNTTPTDNSGAIVDLTDVDTPMPTQTNLSTSSTPGSPPEWKNTPDAEPYNPAEQEQQLDEGAGIPAEGTETPESTQRPQFTYEYPDYDIDQRTSGVFSMGPVCGPGMITGGSGNTYTADFYPDGLSGAKLQIENVKQLQIHASDQIPEGTWCLIARTIRGAVVDTDKGTGVPKADYYIQVPTWM